MFVFSSKSFPLLKKYNKISTFIVKTSRQTTSLSLQVNCIITWSIWLSGKRVHYNALLAHLSFFLKSNWEKNLSLYSRKIVHFDLRPKKKGQLWCPILLLILKSICHHSPDWCVNCCWHKLGLSSEIIILIRWPVYLSDSLGAQKLPPKKITDAVKDELCGLQTLSCHSKLDTLISELKLKISVQESVSATIF